MKLTTKPEPYTYQRTLHWLNRQVAPTLKMAMKLDKVNGTDYIDTMLEQAKLTEKHEKILQQQSAEMQDIVTKESKYQKMWYLIKDRLLVSLGAGTCIVTMAVIQVGSMTDKRMEEMNTVRNEEK